jgi:predicted permease
VGLGANGAFFSLIDAALLRPLPVDAPHELVNVYTSRSDGSGYGGLSYLDYRDLVDGTPAFSGLLGFSGLMATLTGAGDPQVLFGEMVTGNYFSVLGVRPVVGRGFLPEEDRTPGTHPVVVVGHRLWQRRFAGDPGIVGRPITLNGRAYTVVGVAPESFTGLLFRGLPVDVWAPVMMMGQLRTDHLANRGERWLFVKGRLAGDASLEQARATVETIAARLRADHPVTNEGRAFRLARSSDVIFNPDADRVLVPGAAFLLLTGALFVALVCTNVTTLTLARAAARTREFAIRSALGASRARLVRQLMLESALLAAAGCVAGLACARAIASAVVALTPSLPVPLVFDVGLDWRVGGYTAALSVGAAVLMGVLPARRAAAATGVDALRSGSGATRASRRRLGLRDVLLVPQVAISLVLLAVAGLFARSVSSAAAVDPGFDPRGAGFVTLNLGMNGYDRVRAERFYRALTERAARIPGVTAVTVADRVPLDLYGSQSRSIEADAGRAASTLTVQYGAVDASYFAVLGIPIVQGRTFTAAEVETGAPVAIAGAESVRRLWPGQNPIGRRVRAGGSWLEIVGIAGDVKAQTLGESAEPWLFGVLGGDRARLLRVIVKSDRDPAVAVADLRRSVADLDPAVAVFDASTMEESAAVMLAPFRMAAGIGSAMGAFALLLACIGLYGLVAWSVISRHRELGIRAALGARPGALVRAVVRDAMIVVGVGLLAGTVAGLVVAQALSSWLFGISPADPLTFGSTALLMVCAAIAAGIVPARRAVRADPMSALRHE